MDSSLQQIDYEASCPELPEPFKSLVVHADELGDQFWAHKLNKRYPRYDDMDIGLDEIDVFFVYPWPGEQEMMLKLFDSVASEDAILIAYYGDQEICLYRR